MVRLKDYSSEKKSKMSLVELTKLLMLEEKKEMKFSETFARVAEIKGLSEKEKKEKIGQFYTDLNIDGNFVTNGENKWGLKRWYREEKKEEEVVPAPKRVIRRKKSKVGEDEEDIVSEFDMIDVNIDEMVDEYEEDEDDDAFEVDLDEEFDAYDR